MSEWDPRALIGAILDDKYEVQGLVGEGAMGAVFEAVQTMIGRRVAVKVLREEMAASPDMMTRFLQEARVAGSLGHANLCEVTDLGVLPSGAPYLVMPLLVGRSLRAEIEAVGGPLPSNRAFDIIYQVLTAVQAAHDERIVHRDLKPDNVFLTQVAERKDFVKVLDFGISKILPGSEGGGGGGLTNTGMVLGTPYYMAPEQASGSKEVDHRADIYAVGVILFELLTGQRPFGGTSYNEIIVKIVTEPFPRARDRNPAVPEGVEAALQRAVVRDPGARYPSARECKRALVKAAQEAAIPLPHYLRNPGVTGDIPLLDEQDLRRAETVAAGRTLHAAVPPVAGPAASSPAPSAAPGGRGDFSLPDGELQLGSLDGSEPEPEPSPLRATGPSLTGDHRPAAEGDAPSGGPPPSLADAPPLELAFTPEERRPSGTVAAPEPSAPAGPGTSGETPRQPALEPNASPRDASMELDPSIAADPGIASASGGLRPSPPPPEPGNKRRTLILLGMLGGSVLLAGAWYGLGWGKEEKRSSPPRRSADNELDKDDDGDDDEIPANVPVREIRLTFEVTPRSAKLLVRGRAAPGHFLLVPYSEKPLQLQVVAKGYQTKSLSVVPDRNRTVPVHLTPE